MQNHSRTFFSRVRAERFASMLREQGREDIQIWSVRDAFNQTQYTVRWN